jgi:two-component system cell cycle sensor histidine kinase/response regulator CckA
VLTDIVLPGIHGGMLAEALKMKSPHTKILFMSGYQDERIALTEIATAPGSFIEKPFEPIALACKIRETLDAG